MTVAELREALQNQPDDAPVILAKDAEGNAFSPLDEAEPSRWVAYNTWSGEVRDLDSGQGVRAVVLWPVC